MDRLRLLGAEIYRQSKAKKCPTCGENPEHVGWLVCVVERMKLSSNGDKDGSLPVPRP